MRTKSIITLSVVCSIFISIVISFLAFAVLQTMSAEIARNETFSEINEKIRDLKDLTVSFNEGSGLSDIRQMQKILQSLDNTLKTLTAETVREQALINYLQQGFRELVHLTNELIDSDPFLDGSEKERRKILSDQIWIKEQLISDDLNYLSDISSDRIVSAQARTLVLIIALILTLTIAISTIYLLTGRSIMRSQQTLRESERRFRIATNAAKIGIYSRDLKTGKDYWSPEFLAIYGYGPDDPMPLKEGIPAAVHPDDLAHVLAQSHSWFNHSSTSEFNSEHRIIRPDGNVRWVMIGGLLEFDTKGKPLKTHGLVMDITESKQAEEKLQQLNQTLEQRVAERTELAENRAMQLQSLSMELIEAEERERRRIAQLLHDDLQQDMASARFQIQAFRIKYTDEPMLDNIDNILAESITKSRQITQELSPQILEDSSFNLALQWLARNMRERFGLKIELEINTEQEMDYGPVKIFIFRAMKELLFNVFKHSGVKSAKVKLSLKNDKIMVIVEDQGRGFDIGLLDSTVVKDCFGLLSLRERARYMGGNFLIESAPEQGSKFILWVPLLSNRPERNLNYEIVFPCSIY
jgi:PAS domain S-box-containing protein